MIGQNKFKDFLSNWSVPPHFIIVNGEIGSGRTTLIELIKSKFKYQTVICGSSVDEVREVVKMAYMVAENTFYVFYNGDKLSTAAKNALLKVVEETPNNAYFIMRTEFGTIDTLKNRAFYYNLQPYSFNELKEYYKQNNKLDVFEKYGKISKTVGQIKTFLSSPYEDIIDYCKTIIDMISNVSQGNIFNITHKLNLSDDASKWDVNLFLNALEWELYNAYIKNSNDKYFQAIFRLNNVRSELRINGVNKQVVFDNFFLGLKGLL